MSIIPRRPFYDLDRFFEDEEWFLPRFRMVEPAVPEMDVYETDEAVIAEVNLPGIDPNKVEISVENQILTVSGTIEEKKKEKEKGYFRHEIRRGSFERRVRLPVPVNEDKVEAEYEKGILKITMPKLEPLKPKKKKIQIKIKEA